VLVVSLVPYRAKRGDPWLIDRACLCAVSAPLRSLR